MYKVKHEGQYLSPFLDIGLLFAWMTICGFLSVYLGKELTWDLANYHFYNPFAFLNNRWNIDYWPPVFIHGFIVPTIDFLTYFLIRSFSPWWVVFSLGAIHGINFWLLFHIARNFIEIKNKTYNILVAIFLACFGLYGPSVIQGIGSFQHDTFISIFVLLFLWLQIKGLQFYSENTVIKNKFFCLGSCLLGIGVGLKYTAGIFFVGALIGYICLPICFQDRFKIVFLFTMFFILGMLFSAGYWMLLLWQKYHNPFFPFLNNIFHSEYFINLNWRDIRYLPRKTLQVLFYPFYFSFNGLLVSEFQFRDVRFIFIYCLLLISGLLFLWKKIKSQAPRFNYENYWLLAFFVFSYIAWQTYFSIFRYLVVLEILSPIIIFILVKSMIHNTYLRFALLFFIFYNIFLFMIPLSYMRAPWYKTDYFNIRLPNFINAKSQGTVLIAFPAFLTSADPRPSSYLIPFFPNKWRFIGIPFINVKAQITNNESKIISSASGPFYLLTSNYCMPEFYEAAKNKLNLIPNGDCQKIFSDRQAILNEDTLLCPVKKALI